MDSELMNIPTGSLVEMLLVILTCKAGVAGNDANEIGQIHRELQRRGEDEDWIFCRVN